MIALFWFTARLTAGYIATHHFIIVSWNPVIWAAIALAVILTWFTYMWLTDDRGARAKPRAARRDPFASNWPDTTAPLPEALRAELAHDRRPAPWEGHAMLPAPTADLWEGHAQPWRRADPPPMKTQDLMPGADLAPVPAATCPSGDRPLKVDRPASDDVPGYPTPIAAGDDGAAPDAAAAGQAAAEPAAPPPGPAPAIAGPGDLDPTWQAALSAIDAAERGADTAYLQAIHTGTLPISDATWPHLAEGQYGHWHWASDDSIVTQVLTPGDIARMDAEHGRVA